MYTLPSEPMQDIIKYIFSLSFLFLLDRCSVNRMKIVKEWHTVLVSVVLHLEFWKLIMSKFHKNPWMPVREDAFCNEKLWLDRQTDRTWSHMMSDSLLQKLGDDGSEHTSCIHNTLSVFQLNLYSKFPVLIQVDAFLIFIYIVI